MPLRTVRGQFFWDLFRQAGVARPFAWGRNYDKISKMLRLWADRLWSVCAGAGLVLLLAAEGNVCPHWMQPAQKEADRAAGSAEAAESDRTPPEGTIPSVPAANDVDRNVPVAGLPDSSAPTSNAPVGHKPRPLVWSAAWPDVMPARRPWHVDRAAQAEFAGRQSGTVACGPLNQGPAIPNLELGESVPPWRADRFGPSVLAQIANDFQARPVLNPALVTVLIRTGPPC